MVLGCAALASRGERRSFPCGLGGCKAGSVWRLPPQHAAVEASSACQNKGEYVLMSEELHPLCFRRLGVDVSDLGLARALPVFASWGHGVDLMLSPHQCPRAPFSILISLISLFSVGNL